MDIIAYIHKSRGCVELEPGLLNLFPFSKVKNISGKRPDGIFIFGCPNSSMEDLGYYYDKKKFKHRFVQDLNIMQGRKKKGR